MKRLFADIFSLLLTFSWEGQIKAGLLGLSRHIFNFFWQLIATLLDKKTNKQTNKQKNTIS